MLKRFLFAAAVVCGAVLWADTEIRTNWTPDVLKLKSTGVADWNQNRLSVAKGGKGEVILDDASGKTVFRVIGGSGATDYYFKPFLDAKAGDTLQFRIIARGKGSIAAGYYAYDEKLSWFRCRGQEENLTLADQPQEYKIEIKIGNGIRKQTTAKIRLMLSVLPASTAYVGRVEAVLKKGADK